MKQVWQGCEVSKHHSKIKIGVRDKEKRGAQRQKMGCARIKDGGARSKHETSVTRVRD